MMGMQSASDMIAAFVTGLQPDDVDATAMRQAGRALLDTVAVALAGHADPASRIALEYVGGRSAPGMADAWGTGVRLPVEDSAFYNGVAGHVLDFDDVTAPLRGHPSIVLLPPLAALAQAEDLPGRALAVAYVAGFEVMVKIAKAMVGDHYARGWHATATVGLLGAVAACAQLLALSREQTRHALGLAVAQAAGTQANFGAMAKSFQAGHTAASAVRAALLARHGYTSGADVLDGPQGFTRLYGQGEPLADALRTLGQPALEVRASGIEIKKYPLCYATHRALDGMLDLRATHGLALEQVDTVEVLASYRGLTPLTHDRPRTGLQGKFSMQYAMAAALADGHVRLGSFTDAAVLRPAIQAFLPRVTAREVAGPAAPRWNEVRITMRNGAVLNTRVTSLRGSAALPLTDAQLLEKADDCFAFGGYGVAAAEFARAAAAIGDLSVRDILDQCPRAPLPIKA
jgi:2-methylcitrate dehydratase PrpD